MSEQILIPPEIPALTTLYTAFRRGFVFSTAGSMLATEWGIRSDISNLCGYVGKQPFKHDSDGTTKKTAIACGFCDAGTGHYLTRNALVFPRFDRLGQPVGLTFYSADGSPAIRLPDLDQGFFPGVPIPETQRLIVTPDVLSAAVWSGVEFPSTTAVLTASADEEWTEMVYELQHLREIICLWAEDDPNFRSVTETCRLLTLRGISVRHFLLDETLSLSVRREGHAGLLQRLEDFLLPPKPKHTEPEKNSGYHLETSRPNALRFRTPFGLILTAYGGVSVHDFQRLQVTLTATPEIGENHWRYTYRQSLNLYDNAELEQFIEYGAGKTGVLKKQFSEAMDALIDHLEAYRLHASEPEPEVRQVMRPLSDALRQKAVAYLKAPDLMEQTISDLSFFIAGEEHNKLLLWLALTSRLRAVPMSVMLVGPPSSGKTHLLRSVISCFPENEVLSLSLCANSLFFYEEGALKHKVIWLEDVEHVPAKSLTTLQELRRGILTKPVPQKHPANGHLYLQNYTVEGPVVVVGSSTRRLPDHDFYLTLTPDLSEEQDRKVLDYQRLRASGQLPVPEENRLRERFRAVQRVLQSEPPVAIRNPFAGEAALHLPPNAQPVRRMHFWWLQLAETICYYHRFQRPVERDADGEFISVTESDIRWTNQLMSGLGYPDELAPACRKLMEQIEQHLKDTSMDTFRSSDLKKKYGLNTGNLKRWLKSLVSADLLEITEGSAATGYTYRLPVAHVAHGGSFDECTTPEDSETPDNQQKNGEKEAENGGGTVAHDILVYSA